MAAKKKVVKLTLTRIGDEFQISEGSKKLLEGVCGRLVDVLGSKFKLEDGEQAELTFKETATGVTITPSVQKLKFPLFASNGLDTYFFLDYGSEGIYVNSNVLSIIGEVEEGYIVQDALNEGYKTFQTLKEALK